ncbi:MAG: ABC transporter permease [Anaerolineales bacterium]
MRKTWDIAWLYLKTTYRDRSAFIFGVLMPVIFTAVIGLGMRGFGPDEGPPIWRVAVVDNDNGAFSQQLIERLDAEESLEAEALDAETAAAELESGDASAILILPADLSEQLQTGEASTLEFRMNVQEPQAAQVVEQAILAALFQVSSSIDIANTSLRVAERMDLFAQPDAPSEEVYFQDSLEAADEAQNEEPPITLESSQLTRLEGTEVNIPIGFQQSSPGIAVMFAMFFIVGGAASILLEREQGTLRRLLTAPVTKVTILGGKLLGVFIAGIIQFTILVAAGQFLFGVPWGQSPLALLVMVVSFSFAITALGMLISALMRTYAQVDAMSTLLILPLSGLGGAMWPIEIVPDFMQKIALWLPTGWAMRGFQDIIVRGLGLQDVLLEGGVLILFGIVFLAIGVWRFKYE